jgi:hypothetical protein
MGNCGCGRSKKKPLSSKQKAAMKARSSVLSLSKQERDKATNFRNKIIQTRLSICEKCPHSIQTDRDKKFNIRLCHKQNRPIEIVAKLLSSGCPIGKFKVAT